MRKLLFATLFVLAAVPVAAQTVTTIHLTGVPDVVCDEVWQQDGVDMYFTTSTDADCDGGGHCGFEVGETSVFLFASRLVADFGQSYQVTRIEIDVVDYCGTGCTNAFVYNQGELVATTHNTTSGDPEVLVLEMAEKGQPFQADKLAISSCEGEVLGSTIRIYADSVGNEDRPWTSVKGDYR